MRSNISISSLFERLRENNSTKKAFENSLNLSGLSGFLKEKRFVTKINYYNGLRAERQNFSVGLSSS